MNKPKLIIFTGPSGVGKGTVLQEFFKNAENVVYSVSSTTRLPRKGEIDGVHYNFISKEKFEDLIKQDAFLEWAKYSDNYYGTSKSFVQNQLNSNKSVLLEIELQDALKVMEKCPEAMSIFIKPPSFEELERRLRGRKSEDEATIQKRLKIAKIELSHIEKFDYVVENDDIIKASQRLLEIYQKETTL